MMHAGDQTPIAWGRVLRLTRALGPASRLGNLALPVLLVGWLSLVGFIDLVSDTGLGRSGRPGMIWFVMTAYFFHLATGMCNDGWRVLPVAARERRAAAWVMVSVMPLAAALLSMLIDAGLAVFVGEHGLAQRALAQFGLRALCMQAYAALAVCVGNWPATAVALSQMDRRGPRDWLMYGALLVIFVGVVVYGDALLAWPAAGPVCAALAIALCAALLPLALRVIRLDRRPSADAGLFDGLADAVQRLSGLRLSGWSGHFVREARRTALLWLWLALFVLAAQRAMPAPGQLDAHEAAFREGLRQGMSFGTASHVWILPGMAAALLTIMTQQYLFRTRPLLLALPRGERLILATPLFNATLVFAATLAVVWPDVVATPGWGFKLLTGALYGLAMIHLALAINLGATTYARIMANSLVIAVPAMGIGFVDAIAQGAPQRIDALLAPASAASLVVLAASLVWCRWQLRRSRAPYRPWPGATGTWRAA